MAHSEKPTWSTQQLKAAELGQTALNKAGAVGAFVLDVFTGSSSPSYHQLTWKSQKFPELPYPEMRLTTIPGNPHVRRFTPARGWRNAAVVAVSLAELNEARPHEEAEPAVAYIHNRVLHVGILPPDVQLGFINDVNRVGAGFRKAHDDLIPLIGWSHEGKLSVPETPVHVVSPSVHIDNIAKKFPGVPLF